MKDRVWISRCVRNIFIWYIWLYKKEKSTHRNIQNNCTVITTLTSQTVETLDRCQNGTICITINSDTRCGGCVTSISRNATIITSHCRVWWLIVNGSCDTSHPSVGVVASHLYIIEIIVARVENYFILRVQSTWRGYLGISSSAIADKYINKSGIESWG